MILSVDSILTPDWTEQLGDRIFPFEAFISHNREDGSAELAGNLRRLCYAS